MGRYLRLQGDLKAIAEECAAGAAMYFDEEAYALGDMVIKDEEAVKYVEHVVLKGLDTIPLPEGSKGAYELHILDDSGTGRTWSGGKEEVSFPYTLPYRFTDREGNVSEVREPSAVVFISVETPDLFRLPFIEVKGVTRSARYELYGNT